MDKETKEKALKKVSVVLKGAAKSPYVEFNPSDKPQQGTSNANNGKGKEASSS